MLNASVPPKYAVANWLMYHVAPCVTATRTEYVVAAVVAGVSMTFIFKLYGVLVAVDATPNVPMHVDPRNTNAIKILDAVPDTKVNAPERCTLLAVALGAIVLDQICAPVVTVGVVFANETVVLPVAAGTTDDIVWITAPLPTIAVSIIMGVIAEI